MFIIRPAFTLSIIHSLTLHQKRMFLLPSHVFSSYHQTTGATVLSHCALGYSSLPAEMTQPLEFAEMMEPLKLAEMMEPLELDEMVQPLELAEMVQTLELFFDPTSS